MATYETVIGLEVHVELNTKTKIFCGCSTAFGKAVNTQTCPVCMGLPGALPVLNKAVLEKAIAVGLATNCEITRYAKFDRKNYFYPDNPQNYQISQLYLPICRNGWVSIMANGMEKKIGIHEIHMEEDAGKLLHSEDGTYSLVDYNRSGVPLIEIVSEPDMANADEVIAYLEKLRMLIQYLGASDCKLNEGSMRADVNLSIRKAGENTLGTRTEMKNLNSFRAIRRAIENETNRQIKILEAGDCVLQETRRWDDSKEESFAMRSKEDAKDYRYFPDPDLLPIVVSEEWIENIKACEPEFRDAKMQRYEKEYDIPMYDIEIITQSKKMSDLFEEAITLGAAPKKVSNWLMGETMRLLKEIEGQPEDIIFSAEHLYKLIMLVENKVITGTVAKDVFLEVFANDIDPEEYVNAHDLATANDDEALLLVIKQVIMDNPKSVEDYRGGKQKAIGFLVGQTMKAMKGKADATTINQMLKELL